MGGGLEKEVGTNYANAYNNAEANFSPGALYTQQLLQTAGGGGGGIGGLFGDDGDRALQALLAPLAIRYAKKNNLLKPAASPGLAGEEVEEGEPPDGPGLTDDPDISDRIKARRLDYTRRYG